MGEGGFLSMFKGNYLRGTTSDTQVGEMKSPCQNRSRPVWSGGHENRGGIKE